MMPAVVSLPFMGELTGFLIICAIIAYGCHQLGLSPIVGFLITGTVIGPRAAGLIEDPVLVEILAEVGVILLLFEIGLEFSIRRLQRLRSTIVRGGTLQVGGTLLVVTVLLGSFGVAWNVALYTAALVALSSTAVVLGLLSERSQVDTPQGQLSVSMLVYQDLAIVPMVLLIPLLGEGAGSIGTVLWALLTASLVLGAAFLASWYGAAPILRLVARTQRPELFVLTVMAIGLGTAWLVSLANVSLALGAFVAGLVVSESEYREQALSEILPFRTVFTAFFFVSVGMLLNPAFLWDRPLLVLAVIAGILLIKAVIAAGSVLVLGYPLRIAAATGIGLAQVGEFSFVLDRAGQAAGLTPAGLGPTGEQLFITAAVVLMTVTPLLFSGGQRLASLLQTMFATRDERAFEEEDESRGRLEDHVVVVGYGPGGRHLARVLAEVEVPLQVIDLNPGAVQEAREDGVPVRYGDATRPSILRKAGIRRAKLCVVVVNDDEAAYRITQIARQENPTLQIAVRIRFLSGVEAFQQAGADWVIPEEMEAMIRIFAYVLESYRIPSEEIEHHVETLRSGDYRPVRTDREEARRLELEGLEEEGLRTRVIQVRSGAPVVGRTLGDLHLQRDYDLTVLAVRRDEETYVGPSRSFELTPGSWDAPTSSSA